MEKRSTVRQSLRPQINNITFDQTTHLPDISQHSNHAVHDGGDNSIYQKKGKLLKTSLFRNNSRPQVNTLSQDFSDSAVSKFIGDELSIVRVGTEAKIRAAEEMAKIKQRQIVSDEERVRLVEAALSLDAPKVARQAIKDSQQIDRVTRSSASPFLTFDTTSSAHKGSEDEEFLKAVEEVERTRRRMISRANSSHSNSHAVQFKQLSYQHQENSNSLAGSEDVASSLEGLVGGNDEDDDGLTTSARGRKLQKLSAEIRNVRDSYHLETRREEIKYGDAVDRDLFENVKNDSPVPTRSKPSPTMPLGSVAASFARTETDKDSPTHFDQTSHVSHRLRAEAPHALTSQDTAQSHHTAAAALSSDVTSPNNYNNNSQRRSRNQHLKVLMQGSLRDWLSLECHVPMGQGTGSTNLLTAEESDEADDDVVHLPDSQWAASPGLRKGQSLAEGYFDDREGSSSNAGMHQDLDLDGPAERSSPLRSKEFKIKIFKTKDITRSLSGFYPLVIDGGESSDTCSDGLPTPHSMRRTSSQLIYKMHSDSDLHTSAKQEETPFHNLSHALKLLENTLVNISDHKHHHLPSLHPEKHSARRPSLTDDEREQFRIQFRKALWASTLAGAAAGNFIADTVSMRHSSTQQQ